jgi:hypothetical protein
MKGRARLFTFLLLSLGVLFYLYGVPLRGEGEGIIAGRVSLIKPVSAPIYVRAYPAPGRRVFPDIFEEPPFSTYKAVQTEEGGNYRLTGLPPGSYTVWGFLDVNGNGRVDFDLNEPSGWFSAEDGYITPVKLGEGTVKKRVDFTLAAPTLIKAEEKRCKNGMLRKLKGVNVLNVWGTPSELGYAQGFLLAPQIRDMVEFVSIEFFDGSASHYKKAIIPYVEKRFIFSPAALGELKAMISGMKDSGADIYLPSLGRDVNLSDLKALNVYGEWWELGYLSTQYSCSSVSAWGERTKGSELRGELIIGRDMDGEKDLKRTTIHHLLITAYEPAGKKRFISIMWPGFIGTYSGMNEEGVGLFDHAGNSRTDTELGGFIPWSLTCRAVLEEVGRKEGIARVKKVFDSLRSKNGGVVACGAILHLVFPSDGERTPACIIEADREGELIRLPGDVPPHDRFSLVCSNTFLKYKTTPLSPVFNCPRYIKYKERLTSIVARKLPVGRREIVEMLGAGGNLGTEHTIILYPDRLRLEIANEDLKSGVREAAFCRFVSFGFDELFRR